MALASKTPFGTWTRVPVRAPFRLDLTVDALRRLASNAVDVVGDDGTYYRAVRDAHGVALLSVRAKSRTVEFRATGENPQRWLPLVERILGAQANLRDWYARSAKIDWVETLATQLRGLKPPRYPTLWEACAHAVVFAQISIYAGAAIMRRLVELLGEEVSAQGVRTRIFPEPYRWLRADDAALRGAGLSSNKLRYLRSIATALCDGTLDEERLATQATPEAAQTLVAVPGIGPWSAAVV
ncbi:MAG: hypothetical protein JOY69_08760, partial [Candidatus Eremiobacteraeota bacterium]|nr:hypothetical protein [Candidatus Eremiobacteraeota bacterium]